MTITSDFPSANLIAPPFDLTVNVPAGIVHLSAGWMWLEPVAKFSFVRQSLVSFSAVACLCEMSFGAAAG